jgi:hypothetical protein
MTGLTLCQVSFKEVQVAVTLESFCRYYGMTEEYVRSKLHEDHFDEHPDDGTTYILETGVYLLFALTSNPAAAHAYLNDRTETRKLDY